MASTSERTRSYPRLQLPRTFIRYMKMRNAVLHDADLEGADATEANFRGSDFLRANLDGTILNGADLTGARNLTHEQFVTRGDRRGDGAAGLYRPRAPRRAARVGVGLTVPYEVTVLALAVLLQAVQFVLMAVPANMQLGVRRTTGPRDEPLALNGVTGRLHRALGNHFEGLILFIAAVAVVVLGDASSPFTRGCATAYLVARIAYVPLYAAGVSPWRSVAWVVGFGASVLMVVAALI